MPYLRVECHICGAVWDYFDEIYEFDPLRATTGVKIVGCICPGCGSIGFVSSIASGTTNTLVEVQNG